MPPGPTPLAVGRVTDGFPEGCPDMMTVLKRLMQGTLSPHQILEGIAAILVISSE